VKTKQEIKENKVVQALREIHGIKWFCEEDGVLHCQSGSLQNGGFIEWRFDWEEDIMTGDALEMAERGLTRIIP